MSARLLRRARACWDRHRRDESSNSFAVLVILLPVLVGSFGLGVDISRNLYIRTSLQNSLDMATVGGAAATVVTSSGQVVVDAPAARAATMRVYALNREQGPGLSCIGSGSVPGTNLPRCWQAPQNPQVTAKTVSYTVSERSRNAFLPVLGSRFANQDYTLTSSATIATQQGY